MYHLLNSRKSLSDLVNWGDHIVVCSSADTFLSNMIWISICCITFKFLKSSNSRMRSKTASNWDKSLVRCSVEHQWQHSTFRVFRSHDLHVYMLETLWLMSSVYCLFYVITSLHSSSLWVGCHWESLSQRSCPPCQNKVNYTNNMRIPRRFGQSKRQWDGR